MNSRIELFEPAHLAAMELRPLEKARLEADPKSGHHIAALAQFGSGGTLFYGDTVVAIFGFYELWPGVLEVWAFPSVHVEKHAMLYLRTVKRYLRSIEQSHRPHRVQTTSIDDGLHNAWMEFLGFTRETPHGMKNWSVLKQTFNLWSKTYEGGE